MKKVFIVFALILGIVTLALVPGMDKRMYGGSVFLFPFPGVFAAGVGGYYMEGMEVYKFEDVNVFVDGYVGGGFAADFLTIGGVGGGFGLEVDLRGSAVVYKRDWNIEFLGYRIIPALRFNLVVYSDVIGAQLMGYIGRGSIFGWYWDYYLTAIIEWKPKESKYLSFYFWPYPLVFGVDIWEM